MIRHGAAHPRAADLAATADLNLPVHATAAASDCVPPRERLEMGQDPATTNPGTDREVESVLPEPQLPLPFEFPWTQLLVVFLAALVGAFASSWAPITALLNAPSIPHIIRRST